MKTIKCENCGGEIYKNTIVCPHCKERCLSDKKSKTAIILAFCLGFSGIHNFYLNFFDRAGLEFGTTALGVLLVILGILQKYSFFLVFGIILISLVFIAGITEAVLMIKKVINRDKLGKRLR